MLEVQTKDSLNDMLVELPCGTSESFLFTFEGATFRAFPQNANEYLCDYGRDNYRQVAVRGARSLESLRTFAYETGDVIQEVK